MLFRSGRARVTPGAALCVYCCERPGSTRDHVPPKCLFPADVSDLIRVPSCPACNGGFSKDDEYFRNMLAMNASSKDAKATPFTFDSLMRAIERPEARGMASAISESLYRADLITDAGLYAGTVDVYRLDQDRLERVVERIGRALFWHHSGRALSPDVNTWATAAWGFPKIPPAAQAGFAEAAAKLPRPLYELAGGAFKYGGIWGDSDQSAWMMEFHRGVGYVVRTGPAKTAKGFKS